MRANVGFRCKVNGEFALLFSVVALDSTELIRYRPSFGKKREERVGGGGGGGIQSVFSPLFGKQFSFLHSLPSRLRAFLFTSSTPTAEVFTLALCLASSSLRNHGAPHKTSSCIDRHSGNRSCYLKRTARFAHPSSQFVSFTIFFALNAVMKGVLGDCCW